MKRPLIVAATVLMLVVAIKLYRGLLQLDYPYTFTLNTSNQSQSFTVRPTLKGDNEWFKIRLKGVVDGKMIVSILPYYSGNNDSLTIGSVYSVALENKPDLDTTLMVDYYGSEKKDKVVIQCQPMAAKRIDVTISAGVFGIPFGEFLTWFVNLTSSD